jgi:hypothetical protein
LSNDALLRHSIRRTMQILEGALAILITLAIGGIGPAFAQDAMNKAPAAGGNIGAQIGPRKTGSTCKMG